MQEYICEHYDTDYLKKVYIIGDGANWIESGTEYIAKSVFVIDKFHLAEYIHKASRQMLDEADYAKECIYKSLMKRDYNGFAKIISKMKKSADNPEAVDKCSKYVSRHWPAVMRCLHDENVYGSSAEGHVSNMYSSRMSSRPMAWSADGVDGMCRLRCYISNYGESKIIDLVEYKRKIEKKELRATGTDGKVIRNQIAEASAAYVMTEYNQARSYIDRLQATIPGLTAAKAFSIRNQLYL